MSGWTPKDLIEVIGAVAAAIVAIIQVWKLPKGKQAAKKLDELIERKP